MDDFKVWFYLILGAIYLISRLLRKKPDTPSPSETPRAETSVPDFEVPQRDDKPKALTFDELLREITQSKDQAPAYQPASAPKTDYVDYDDDLKDEEQNLEEVNYEEYYRKEKPSKAYEEAKTAAFYRPSLEETMKIGDTVVNFSKFRVFEEEEKRNLLEEYTADLRDPEGLKKAVVLSEILNRRF